MALYCCIVILIFCILKNLILVLRKKRNLKRCILCAGKLAVRILGGLFFVFMLFCGVNYQRNTFADEIGLEVGHSSREELLALCEEMVNTANELNNEVNRDGAGNLLFDDNFQKSAVLTMEKIGNIYEILGGYYPMPKLVFITDLLSYQKVTGVYSPFTVEANYNGAIPEYELPFTVCHELSHLKGFMREEEANFIAWLACLESDVAEFRYSAAVIAFVYAGNDLYRYDKETYRSLLGSLSEAVLSDLQRASAYWSRFDGPVAEAHTQVNDVYLKANSQTDGVESYDQIVELILAYRRLQ